MTIFKFPSASYCGALETQEPDWIDFSGAGFSLWVLVLARTNPHRLKPVLLKARKFDISPPNDINGFSQLFSEEKSSCPILE
jgi:hypothetical protein